MTIVFAVRGEIDTVRDRKCHVLRENSFRWTTEGAPEQVHGQKLREVREEKAKAEQEATAEFWNTLRRRTRRETQEIHKQLKEFRKTIRTEKRNETMKRFSNFFSLF